MFLNPFCAKRPLTNIPRWMYNDCEVMPVAYKDKQQLFDYNNTFNKSRYDTIKVLPSKEEGQQIREHAALAGLSVSSYILKAVREQMAKDDKEPDR